MTDDVSIEALDGRTFSACRADPAAPNGRGLIVLPEVYNVNQWVRGVARRHAARGYTVLVPDLFWRQRPGAHYEYDQPDPARAQGEAIDVDAVVGDIGQLARTLRRTLGDRAVVGVIGYCLGGRLAMLAGVREPVDAVVSYYGVKFDQHLDELARLDKPALFHFGGRDPWVPAETVDAVKKTLAGRANVAIHDYPQAGHGFDRNGHPPFDEAASALAFTRTTQVLDAMVR